MEEDIRIRKAMLREEAIRARGLLSLSAQALDAFEALFFKTIPLKEDSIIAAYWPKDREFDTRPLLDALLAKGFYVALPITQRGTKILKFARWDHGTALGTGAFEISEPVVEEDTVFVEPDVFIVPLLAFDRRGGRLGYGGGYYDATLSHYKKQKKIQVVGAAYAEQACLFNLPSDDHDVRMDFVITPQQAHSFRKE